MIAIMASVFGDGDALGIGLVITILGAGFTVGWMLHRAAKADTERHHALDMRLTLQEQQNKVMPLLTRVVDILERRERDQSERSDVYSRTDERGH